MQSLAEIRVLAQQTWVTFQEQVTFDAVAVDFTQDEWELLGPAQKTLYHHVMLEIFRHLVTVGEAMPV